jgi:hypothetical protein
MQTGAIDRVAGISSHDARFWFLIVWFLLLFLLVCFGFSAFLRILGGFIL